MGWAATTLSRLWIGEWNTSRHPAVDHGGSRNRAHVASARGWAYGHGVKLDFIHPRKPTHYVVAPLMCCSIAGRLHFQAVLRFRST
jgi:hypothetical protein